MKIKVFNNEYLVTSMILMNKDNTSSMKYNVFDENYQHVTTVNSKDEEEFIKQFKTKLITNKL